MKDNFQTIIGHVSTIDLEAEDGTVIPGGTYPVIKVTTLAGMKCYITSHVHKTFADGSIEPLIVMEILVDKFVPTA